MFVYYLSERNLQIKAGPFINLKRAFVVMKPTESHKYMWTVPFLIWMRECATELEHNQPKSPIHGVCHEFVTTNQFWNSRFKINNIATATAKSQEITRMHSSRMRTVRCSGRPGGRGLPGGCLPRGMLPLPLAYCMLGYTPPAQCMLGYTPHPAQCMLGYTPHPAKCMLGYPPPPSPDRILDTRLWKHYFSANTLADGNDVLF